MNAQKSPTPDGLTQPRRRMSGVDAVGEWRSRLTKISSGFLLYETLTGLAILVLPFSPFNQFNVLLHTILGVAMLVPVLWYCWRHWVVRRKGKLSHYQLMGYIAVALLLACLVSGIVVTLQGVFGTRLSLGWDLVHLVTGLAMAIFIIVHVAMVVLRKVNREASKRALAGARRSYYGWSGGLCVVFILVGLGWEANYQSLDLRTSFDDTYNWRYGEDRPFAPSMSRIENQDWQDHVIGRVESALPSPKRKLFQASLVSTKRDPMGLFARLRQGADDAKVDSPEREAIEAVLSEESAHVRTQGAIDPRLLGGSAGCGTSGCHTEIYTEWLPSAHRYSSLDVMFQDVQELMVAETSAETTRYCGGCHDPISLFAGAKNAHTAAVGNPIGMDEGTSCLVCHSIVQTDVQGNGDYTIRPPERYIYELHEDDEVAKFLSDFLIRIYPNHHITEYSKPLYKTAEFCAACHKQYLDVEVNTDIGKVQGQNQYDSWMNSRWFHEGNPDATISCRECHMPLQPSTDPASGDPTDYNRSLADGMHRGHRMCGANQYIPTLQNLEGGADQVAEVEKWLRGQTEIPEIADKWTRGPVVRLAIDAPETIAPGEQADIRVLLTNNKTGHDFPTGPLDMIESWIELTVVDENSDVLYHTGGVDASTDQIVNSQVLFKATGFDREGKLIDRHNLWDLVGASYKRSLYPGVTDSFEAELVCPSMARGRLDIDPREAPGVRVDEFAVSAAEPGTLRVKAVLWYRKANPEFLDRVYGTGEDVRSPVTAISETEAVIRVLDVQARNQ
ncbi:MAG: cytochrome b/b6 domain-containing protein [Phycisphaerae bacterium]|nr:cytochrome b/b6 domain-containing protein [Phycisphaerae bacterium]